jgi:hypothetical protein
VTRHELNMSIGATMAVLLGVAGLSGSANTAGVASNTAALEGPAASGSFSTSNGASGSSSGSGSGFEWPPFIYGGDALSLRAPMQFGLGSFVPRARLAFHWDHQLSRPHWLSIGVAGVFDRADWQAIGLSECGLAATGGNTCTRGTIAGFDLSAEYVYRLYIKRAPFVVPSFRGGLVGGWWKYSDLFGARAQSRISTLQLGMRVGAGARLFLLQWLGVGLDVDVQIGAHIHRDQVQSQAATRPAQFGASIAVLPVVVEIRV